MSPRRRQRKGESRSVTYTWDGTYAGLARIFEQIAARWDRLAAENPHAAAQLTERAQGLRDAAKTTRGLTSGQGGAR